MSGCGILLADASEEQPTVITTRPVHDLADVFGHLTDLWTGRLAYAVEFSDSHFATRPQNREYVKKA
jgi:hypothetical protein